MSDGHLSVRCVIAYEGMTLHFRTCSGRCRVDEELRGIHRVMPVNRPPVLRHASAKCKEKSHFGGVDGASTADRDDAVCMQGLQKCGCRNDICFTRILMNRRKDTSKASASDGIYSLAYVRRSNQIWIHKQRDPAITSCDRVQGCRKGTI